MGVIMPAEILSLDMDWFNYLSSYKISQPSKIDLKRDIQKFFTRLNKECVLPEYVDLVSEHHYLYPWSMKLMERLFFNTMNVINIDDHHDFYNLGWLKYCEEDEVNCSNFFGIMVDQNLLENYTWICNRNYKNNQKKDLLSSLKKGSITIQEFKENVEVYTREDVFNVLSGKKFDGFIIVRSPKYTFSRRTVYDAVNKALDKEKLKVRQYTCRSIFRHHKVGQRANSLFQTV